MNTETEVTAVVTTALNVMRLPGFKAAQRITVIARHWAIAGVGKSRNPAVWAAKKAILADLIRDIQREKPAH